MTHDLQQFALLALTGAGIIMIGAGGRVGRWGALLSLAAQPFWFWVTWQAQQWGIFTLSVLYAGTFARMVWLGFVARAGDCRR